MKQQRYWPSREFLGNASSVLKQMDFFVLDPDGGERHGSWEFTWFRKTEVRRSWVTLAATPMKNERVILEVWAGADAGSRYGREVVFRRDDFPSLGFDDPGMRSVVLKGITEAASRAQTVELKQTHQFVGRDRRRPASA